MYIQYVQYIFCMFFFDTVATQFNLKLRNNHAFKVQNLSIN